MLWIQLISWYYREEGQAKLGQGEEVDLLYFIMLGHVVLVHWSPGDSIY